jgi:hypothetical protein
MATIGPDATELNGSARDRPGGRGSTFEVTPAGIAGDATVK